MHGLVESNEVMAMTFTSFALQFSLVAKYVNCRCLLPKSTLNPHNSWRGHRKHQAWYMFSGITGNLARVARLTRRARSKINLNFPPNVWGAVEQRLVFYEDFVSVR